MRCGKGVDLHFPPPGRPNSQQLSVRLIDYTFLFSFLPVCMAISGPHIRERISNGLHAETKRIRRAKAVFKSDCLVMVHFASVCVLEERIGAATAFGIRCSFQQNQDPRHPPLFHLHSRAQREMIMIMPLGGALLISSPAHSNANRNKFG